MKTRNFNINSNKIVRNHMIVIKEKAKVKKRRILLF